MTSVATQTDFHLLNNSDNSDSLFSKIEFEFRDHVHPNVVHFFDQVLFCIQRDMLPPLCFPIDSRYQTFLLMTNFARSLILSIHHDFKEHQMVKIFSYVKMTFEIYKGMNGKNERPFNYVSGVDWSFLFDCIPKFPSVSSEEKISFFQAIFTWFLQGLKSGDERFPAEWLQSTEEVGHSYYPSFFKLFENSGCLMMMNRHLSNYITLPLVQLSVELTPPEARADLIKDYLNLTRKHYPNMKHYSEITEFINQQYDQYRERSDLLFVKGIINE